jgi:hypothetical protein
VLDIEHFLYELPADLVETAYSIYSAFKYKLDVGAIYPLGPSSITTWSKEKGKLCIGPMSSPIRRAILGS